MRTEFRLPETCGVLSTRMMAFPALLIDVKLLDIYEKIRRVIRVHTGHQTQDYTHRGLLIDKLDQPIGRITAGEEVPSLEKRLTRLRNGNKGISQMVGISKFLLPF